VQSLHRVESLAVPLLRANIDTDIITPMRRIIARSTRPLAHYAFEPLRYLDGDGDRGLPNPDFVLNDPAFAGAGILLTGENFGCGSSRETAPAALHALGFRVIIGSTFGDIFSNNCFQRGILIIALDADTVAALAAEARQGRFVVDLESRTIVSPQGLRVPFAVNPLRRELLLSGLDDIGMSLRLAAEIAAFQEADRVLRPWVYRVDPSDSPWEQP
jgi:3-isopropylmalate/(R)-2-methylmalate dehydratase small subunit